MTRLTLDDISLNYGDRAALENVSLDLEGGALVALVGPNGAGKSTLLRICGGLLDASRGSIRLDDAPLGEVTLAKRARTIAYLAPDGRSAWPMSVRRIVALGRAPYLKPLRALSDEDETQIDTALARAGIAHLADRSFATLSSGERARVLLARALATQADVLLLDEPTAALDPQHQLAVMGILKAEAERGVLVILAAHALDLVARYSDQVVLLEQGHIIADGPAQDSLSEAHIARVFGVSAPGGIKPTELELSD